MSPHFPPSHPAGHPKGTPASRRAATHQSPHFPDFIVTAIVSNINQGIRVKEVTRSKCLYTYYLYNTEIPSQNKVFSDN